MRHAICASLLVALLTGCGTAKAPMSPLTPTTTGYMQAANTTSGYMQGATPPQTQMAPTGYESPPPIATAPMPTAPPPSNPASNPYANQATDPPADLPSLDANPVPVSLTPPTAPEPKQSFLGKVVTTAKSLFQRVKDKISGDDD